MDKIKWCAKKGLILIEPNKSLSDSYLVKAKEALESIELNKHKDWKISTAYYTLYFSLYSILTKIGLKCEIHSCTLEFARRFLDDHFDKEEFEFLEDSLKARIDSLYYTDRSIPDEHYNKMLSEAPEFYVKCKSILVSLNENKIKDIRKKFLLALKTKSKRNSYRLHKH